MPIESPTLYGQAPDSAPVALLLIDVINDFRFEDADRLRERANPIAEKLAVLKRRFDDAELPVIYCNDNFGRWRSNFDEIVEYCRSDKSNGQDIVDLLTPSDSDYAVLKAKESGFHETNLAVLLKHLGVERLVIGGFTTDICVLLTAMDAYLRDYDIIVPEDGATTIQPEHHAQALEYARRVLGAGVKPVDELHPAEMAQKSGAASGT